MGPFPFISWLSDHLYLGVGLLFECTPWSLPLYLKWSMLLTYYVFTVNVYSLLYPCYYIMTLLPCWLLHKTSPLLSSDRGWEQVVGCDSIFSPSEMEFDLWVPTGRGISSWHSGRDGVAESQFWIACRVCAVTPSFTAMSLLLFCRLTVLAQASITSRMKEMVNNLSVEFCAFWYYQERILLYLEAFCLKWEKCFPLA